MSTYEDITRQVGDQWVAAFKQAEETVAEISRSVHQAAPRVAMPQFPVPEQLTRLRESLGERLPRPSEIVEANFELTQRLLAAQRDLSLSLIAAVEDPKGDTARTPVDATGTKEAEGAATGRSKGDAKG